MVIIDPLSDAFTLENENSNAEVKAKVINPCRNAARETKTLWIISHHKGKLVEDGNGAAGNSAYGARGASSLDGAMRSVLDISLKKAPDGTKTTRFEFAKVKARGIEPFMGYLDFETGLHHIYSEQAHKERALAAAWTEIWPLVKHIPQSGEGIKRADLMRAYLELRGGTSARQIPPADRSKFNRMIDKAITHGAVVKLESGNYGQGAAGEPLNPEFEYVEGASRLRLPESSTTTSGGDLEDEKNQ